MTNLQWVPLWGDFAVEGDVITFKGSTWMPDAEVQAAAAAIPSAPTDHPVKRSTVGTILCSQSMVNGTISADVEFEEVYPDTGCELIASYNVESQSQISAGIPNRSDASFSIREWSPPKLDNANTPVGGWRIFSAAGSRSFLTPGKKIALRVKITGSNIALEMNGVQVATATITNPLSGPHQIGIWCCNRKDIKISRFTVDATNPRAFIISEFKEPYDGIYNLVIKDACKEFGLEAVRADEIFGPGMIISDITKEILAAQVMIADISPVNANVYFEVGYALALQKPIILLAESQTKLPFDVSGFRVLFYANSISGREKMVEGLRNHLASILRH